MNFYSHDTYGERVAGVYDDWHSDYDPSTIDMLAELAGDGRALELGIGTGRIALPLSARGVEVHGIDAAVSMISRLRAKPGSEQITVTQGNFAEIAVQQVCFGLCSLQHFLFVVDSGRASPMFS